MNNVLFHIGYHKTGSSWLQKQFFNQPNSDFVLLSDGNSGQTTFITDIVKHKEVFYRSPFDLETGNERIVVDNFLKDIHHADSKILVLSHERLSGNPHSSGSDALTLAQRLKNTCPKAKILLVIREQLSWMRSNYIQYLYAGGVKDFRDYYSGSKDLKIPNFSPEYLKYHFLISYYMELFGSENVLVYPFEELVKDKIGFVKSLAHFMGRDEIQVNYNDSKKENIKKDIYLTYLTRKLNYMVFSNSLNGFSTLHGSSTKKMALGLKKAMSYLVSEKREKILNEELLAYLSKNFLDYYAESNQLTKSLTQLDLTKYGYQ